MTGLVTLNVKADIDKAAAGLTDFEKRQLPFAVARALNDVTKGAVADIRAALPKIFDRPVPFTLNAFYAIPVTNKRELRASVAIRDFAPKGTPASKYLAPEIEGGERRVKRFERRLDVKQTIPAAGALLDQHGNMQRRQIGDILQHLGAFADTGQNLGPAKKKKLEKKKLLTRKGQKYFIAKSKVDGKPLGIWNLLGRGVVVPVLLFTRRAPVYKPRLDFRSHVLASYARRFASAFKARLAEAKATARP